jgi:hypothetical protein
MNTTHHLEIFPCEKRSFFRHTVLLSENALHYALGVQQTAPTAYSHAVIDIMQVSAKAKPPKNHPDPQ